MSNFKLNLPTDIPWKRRCVSRDMMDQHLCDEKSPYRWRSSIAVFEYEPEEENQTYEGMTITYLKVSCTVTGYQEDPAEIGVKRSRLSSYWRDADRIDDYLNQLVKYYPCYGAVLEVAVGPEDEEGTALEDYPYFLDFEPKKRELYELVTKTGETMTRSLAATELGKSNTSLRSHEVVDVDKGWAASGQVKYKDVDVSLSGARQGEWGTRDMTQEQSSNTRNTDTSQEMRETKSHTTQLTQMYHQLDSYHLGTNRAVFFMQPRPHTLETEHTFVIGPRNIEGIQDFVFVVVRPRNLEKLCVEAYLETGHVGKVPRASLEEVPGSEMATVWEDKYEARPKGDDDATTVYDSADRVWQVSAHNPGYKIKNAAITAGPPYKRWNYSEPNLVDVHPHIAEWNEDYIRVSGKVHSGFANYAAGKDRWEEISYPFRVDIKLVKKDVVVKSDDTLFLTARKLCCGKDRIRERPDFGIVYEREIPALVDDEHRFGESVPIGVANRAAMQIREAVVGSRNDTAHRHARPVSLSQADFVARSAARLLSRTMQTRLAQHENVPERIREKLRDVNQDLTVHEMLMMPSQMVQDVFDLSDDDALELRDTVLGLANTDYDPRKVWLTDAQLARLFNRQGRSQPETTP